MTRSAKNYEPFSHLSVADKERIKAQVKDRKCLNCTKVFTSYGKQNRLCLNCRNPYRS